MRVILIWLILWGTLFGAELIEKKWKKNHTFSDYLKAHDISVALIATISKEDQKFLSDIQNDYTFYELLDEEGFLLNALIPISEEMQIHLTREENSTEYTFDIVPIVYTTQMYYAKVILQSNPYTDTFKTLNNKNLAKRLSSALRGSINDRKLQPGDEINFIYNQSIRMGKRYLMPKIKVIRIKSKNKEQFVYIDEDGYGYKSANQSQQYVEHGKKKISYTRRVAIKGNRTQFRMPLRRIRVTSSFSRKRWHPILRRYRPHHGTDFGAKRGTPLYAVAAGKVTYAGWMGGYGKVVKIRHKGGYESLYAHQSRIRIKRGRQVKRGQVIGYVGSTGRSTGPHLHFGLKKRGRWVNPMRVLRKKVAKKTVLKTFTKYEKTKTIKYKEVTIKNPQKNKEILLHYIKEEKASYIWEKPKKRILKVVIHDSI